MQQRGFNYFGFDITVYGRNCGYANCGCNDIFDEPSRFVCD